MTVTSMTALTTAIGVLSSQKVPRQEWPSCAEIVVVERDAHHFPGQPAALAPSASTAPEVTKSMKDRK